MREYHGEQLKRIAITCGAVLLCSISEGETTVKDLSTEDLIDMARMDLDMDRLDNKAMNCITEYVEKVRSITLQLEERGDI